MPALKNAAGMFEQSIDGKVYEFAKWGAESATDSLLDLTALMGKSLGMLFAGSGKVDLDLLSLALDHLTNSAVERKPLAKGLMRKLVSDSVICDGKQILFDSHYAGNLFHMFKVMSAALEVQYGNFFAGLKGAGGGMGAVVAGITNQGPVA